MTERTRSMDISDTPELLRLAEHVHRSHEARVLQRNGKDLAMIVPLPRPPKKRRGKEKTEADYAAFRHAAGGWKGLVDTDKLKEDIYESRRISSRPPIEL